MLCHLQELVLAKLVFQDLYELWIYLYCKLFHLVDTGF